MKDDKRIVDIDHANKQLSRFGKNPNTLKRQAMQREAAALAVPPHVAVPDREAKKKKDPS